MTANGGGGNLCTLQDLEEWLLWLTSFLYIFLQSPVKRFLFSFCFFSIKFIIRKSKCPVLPWGEKTPAQSSPLWGDLNLNDKLMVHNKQCKYNKLNVSGWWYYTLSRFISDKYTSKNKRWWTDIVLSYVRTRRPLE